MSVLVVASWPLGDPRPSQVSLICKHPCPALLCPMMKNSLICKVISNPGVLFPIISDGGIDPKMHVNFEKVLLVLRK